METHDSGKDFQWLEFGAEGARPQWTRGLGLGICSGFNGFGIRGWGN